MYDYDDNRNRMVLEEQAGELEARSAAYVTRVMGWMCLGLLTTLVAAVLTLASPTIFSLVYGSGYSVIAIFIVEFALVIALSAALHKLSPAVATVLFMLYAAVTGLTFSVLALAYDLQSIILAFGVTAGIFLMMALYGFITHRDLTKMGSLLFFGLLGILVAGVANWFLQNSMLDFIITCVGVVIFIGLIAYDTQKIKGIYQQAVVSGRGDDDAMVHKLAIYGALALYLDFINLFLRILRIFGRKRN